jgi:hypothetical protein
MTHAGYTQPERDELGITDRLVRISVGCEDADDLVADLEQALEGIQSLRSGPWLEGHQHTNAPAPEGAPRPGSVVEPSCGASSGGHDPIVPFRIGP